MDFTKFDETVDIEGLKHDIETAGNSDAQYEDVMHGTYEVKIQKMELTESKKGSPMVTVWFKILNGDFKNHLIFMNQVVTQGFQLHIVNEFLRSLDSGVNVTFESFRQYADLIDIIFNTIDAQKEYGLEYGEKKGFNTFKITQVFNV